jgi:soluble P-type ATPase
MGVEYKRGIIHGLRKAYEAINRIGFAVGDIKDWRGAAMGEIQIKIEQNERELAALVETRHGK